MEYNLFDIFTGTPMWVWAVFIYLIWMGAQATKKRTVLIARLPITPIIFAVWSLCSLYTKYGLNQMHLAIWAIVYVLGILIGMYGSPTKIEANLKQNSVTLPGSYAPFLLAISFFTIKYFIGVTYALHPAFKTHLLWYGTDVSASACITGISWGRLIAIMNSTLQSKISK